MRKRNSPAARRVNVMSAMRWIGIGRARAVGRRQQGHGAVDDGLRLAGAGAGDDRDVARALVDDRVARRLRRCGSRGCGGTVIASTRRPRFEACERWALAVERTARSWGRALGALSSARTTRDSRLLLILAPPALEAREPFQRMAGGSASSLRRCAAARRRRTPAGTDSTCNPRRSACAGTRRCCSSSLRDAAAIRASAAAAGRASAPANARSRLLRGGRVHVRRVRPPRCAAGADGLERQHVEADLQIAPGVDRILAEVADPPGLEIAHRQVRSDRSRSTRSMAPRT